MKYFTTSFNPTGNRLVEECLVPSDSVGKVTRTLSVFSTLRLSDESRMMWAVGSTSPSSQFVVSHRNKTVNRYDFESGVNDTFLLENSPDRPLLASLYNTTTLIPTLSYPPLTSNFSAALPLFDGSHLMVTTLQHLRQLRSNGNDVTSLSLFHVEDPLLDANIVYSETNKLWAVYTGATSNRYVNGVLGDNKEAGSLQILRYDETLKLVYASQKIVLEGDDLVYEGLGPMWADVDGDGIDDLVTTISGTNQGSALAVYLVIRDDSSPSGFVIKEYVTSDFIGEDSRWLHQVAVGPLGPYGEIEVVEIRTPHFGGQVRYYRLTELGSLELVASTQEYTSHEINSRNLDQVTVGDFDGDGIPELVVQDQSQETLYGLQRTNCGVNVAWNVSLPFKLQTNIAVSCNTERNVMNILFATQDSLMRLEFAPSKENVVSGAVAACEASGGGNAASGAIVRSSSDVLWVTTLCFLLLRWTIRS